MPNLLRQNVSGAARAATDPALLLQPRGTPGAELSSYDPSWTEMLGAGVQSGMEGLGFSRPLAQQYGSGAETVAGMTPGVGQVLALNDLARASESGDLGGMGWASLGLIPGAGGEAKAGRAALAETMSGMKSAEPLAGGRIAQRFPTSKIKGGDNPLTENLLINMDVMKSEPKKLQQASDTIAPYPNTTRQMMEMNPEERVNALRDQSKENLLALWDMMPPEARKRASQWYLGANRIANERAAEVGAHPHSAAGVYAAMSPQKDWFQNVYLGDAVLRTMGRDPKMTPDMLSLAKTLPAYKPEHLQLLEQQMGKDLSSMSPMEQALTIRLYDELNGPKQYSRISPEGDYGDLMLNKSGKPTKPAWGSFNEIEKAVRAAQAGGDTTQISPLMGGAHKVRNFYNNIVAPIGGEPFGDITADTHQIAASLFRPLSGNTAEVGHGLGTSPPKGIAGAPTSAVTGMQGLYPIYADATRLAAAERGVPVREMQSVPWEAIRSIFPAEFKTAKNMGTVDDIWRSHGRGELSTEEARRRVLDVAGGFRPPTW